MEIARKSIKGNYRKENQDRIEVFEKKETIFAILCDGMGGHYGGDLAAIITVNSFKQSYDEHNITIKNCQRWFFETVEKIKKEMKILGINDPRKMDMGTTATAVLIFKNEKHITVFNIGDSRTYVLTNKNSVKQVTRDQNLYNKLINEGIDTETARKNLFSHSLTSSIGPEKSTSIEITELKDDIYNRISKILLTSDGVHGFLEKKEIEEIISDNTTSSFNAVERLIKTAQMNNSTDNLSAIIIKLKE